MCKTPVYLKMNSLGWFSPCSPDVQNVISLHTYRSFGLLFPDGLKNVWKVSGRRLLLTDSWPFYKERKKDTICVYSYSLPLYFFSATKRLSLRAFVHFMPGPLPIWATHHFLSAGTDDIILDLLPAHCKCTPHPCSPASVQLLFSNPTYLKPFRAESLQCFIPFHSSPSSDWL